MRKIIVGVMWVLMSLMTFAEPTVTDVVAKQRYPWNGLVDITCKVSGIDGTADELKLVLAAVMPDTGNARSIRNFWVVRGGSNSIDRVISTNGNYRLLWDAAADLGTVDYSNMVVRVLFNIHDKVQLWEGGPYWATTNIGADKPEDYGYYFWWGDTVGYKRENDKWVASDETNLDFFFSIGRIPIYRGSFSTLESEGWVISRDGAYILPPEHDAAQKHWGGDWRMPTKQELVDLNNNCDWIWTTINGVNGNIVRGRGSYASNSIFLPCAGFGVGDSLDDVDTRGGYWSSVLDGRGEGIAIGACALVFLRDYSIFVSSQVSILFGYSIRPVQGSSK